MPLEPKGELKCPVCKGNARYKEYSLQTRHYKVAGDQYRIDLWFKCCTCAHVWQHGVSVEKEYYIEISKILIAKVGRVRPLHILEAIDLQENNAD